MPCPCGCEDEKDPTAGVYELCEMAEAWYESLAEACPGELCKCDRCDPGPIDPTPWLS